MIRIIWIISHAFPTFLAGACFGAAVYKASSAKRCKKPEHFFTPMEDVMNRKYIVGAT
jgi:hypothetical protein